MAGLLDTLYLQRFNGILMVFLYQFLSLLAEFFVNLIYLACIALNEFILHSVNTLRARQTKWFGIKLFFAAQLIINCNRQPQCGTVCVCVGVFFLKITCISYTPTNLPDILMKLFKNFWGDSHCHCCCCCCCCVVVVSVASCACCCCCCCYQNKQTKRQQFAHFCANGYAINFT